MYVKSLLMGASLLLTGCANLNSINHKRTLSSTSPSIFSMDARQRLVISRTSVENIRVYHEDENGVPIYDKDGNQRFSMATVPGVRMCAEQFPDVFTVLSASLSAQMAAKNENEVKSLSGSLAAAMQESGTTIARTQTVNLLREAMYRTCERYMNGALDNDSFALQAIRDQQNMVSVLAIEQLTGVVTPPSSSLSGVSASLGVYQEKSIEMAKLLAEAKKALDKSDAELKDAQSKFETALKATGGDEKSCETITEDTKKQTCRDAEKTRDEKKTKFDRETVYYERIQKLSDESEKAVQAAVARASANNERKTNNNVLWRGEDLKVIADAVSEIVKHTYEANNMNTACIQILLSKTIKNNNKIDPCTQHLQLESERMNEFATQAAIFKDNERHDALEFKDKARRDQIIVDDDEDERQFQLDKIKAIEKGRVDYLEAQTRVNEASAKSIADSEERRLRAIKEANIALRERKILNSEPAAFTDQSAPSGVNNQQSNESTKNKLIIRPSSSISGAKIDELISKLQAVDTGVTEIKVGTTVTRRGVDKPMLRFNTSPDLANHFLSTLKPYINNDIKCEAAKSDTGYNVLKPGEIEIFIPTSSSIDLTGGSALAGSSQTCTE